ncbi:MAG: hypothetical protein ACR2MG_02925 [Pyrinomonadaceae bacterium]
MKIKSMETKYYWHGAFALSLAIAALLFIGINFGGSSNAAPRVETPIENIAPAGETHLVAAVDLTGVWKGDDGATYYIRHIPRKPSSSAIFICQNQDAKDDVYWFGQGSGFGNVFHGVISKGQIDQVSGEWADVPVGSARNSGNLKLAIASQDRLVMMGEPGNFAAREWKRVTIKLPKNLPLLKPNN